MTGAPGVYRMLDDAGDVLYVGKAKSLKRRLASYANPAGLSTRSLKMISLTRLSFLITSESYCGRRGLSYSVPINRAKAWRVGQTSGNRVHRRCSSF